MFAKSILEHYQKYFGSYDDSGHRFFPGAACSATVYRFPKSAARDVITYAGVHAHAGKAMDDGHSVQFFAVSREMHVVAIDLVAVCATRRCGEGEELGAWSVLQLAQPIPGTSGMTWLLTAPPAFESPGFEHLSADGVHARFLWVVPIFESEARFRQREGAEALESKLFAKGVDLADFRRTPAT